MAEQVLHCFNLCPPVVPVPLPENNWQIPCCQGGGGGGGSFTLNTLDTDSIAFNGDGTSGNPLTATALGGQTINFEIAIGKINGLVNDEAVAVYVPAKQCSIYAGLAGSQFKVDDQVNDIVIEIMKNGASAGVITIAMGSGESNTVASQINLMPGDMLEFYSRSTSEFSLLGITILGLRTLDYVP